MFCYEKKKACSGELNFPNFLGYLEGRENIYGTTCAARNIIIIYNYIHEMKIQNITVQVIF